MRRFLSCSHWGLYDVTPFPWCCPLDATDVIDVFYIPTEDEYDGTE